jgi:tRNA modification GTPase
MQQMRGGFSNEIAKLREELLNFASLSNSNSTLQKKMWNLRTEQFNELLNRIEFVLKRLIDSFAVGNVIKNGFRLLVENPMWEIDTVECLIE